MKHVRNAWDSWLYWMPWLALVVTVFWCVVAYGAGPTAQQQCSKKLSMCWQTYTACIQRQVGLLAEGKIFDAEASSAYARCRHTFNSRWDQLQKKTGLAGTSCVGTRFVANGDGTVSDAFTRLTWELKTAGMGGIHDLSTVYTWSVDGALETGTVFTLFLPALNDASFGSSNGWRAPTLAELQTLIGDYPCVGAWGSPGCKCSAPGVPCSYLQDLGGPDPKTLHFWTGASSPVLNMNAGDVTFLNGFVSANMKANSSHIRAVRGGW